jgi:hypothetical protein
LTNAEKETQVERALAEKKNLVEQMKREKETYYDQKSKCFKELEQMKLN